MAQRNKLKLSQDNCLEKVSKQVEAFLSTLPMYLLFNFKLKSILSCSADKTSLSSTFMMSFFARYRVLTLGFIGIAIVHAGWYYIASDPVFNPEKKVLEITPAYFKSKRAKETQAGTEDGSTKSE